ncbi:TrmB family transcriptional regulator [Halopiger goleimassiliensis]|uniref:TrmB family transcriptional regulator n=1 Tax=Halopiger goleimassiliensis TaxID=1293048 RepID=UPI0006783465|nr:helix-turn-helix domain-containing protein [Halopiger goleimassiliensis]
MTQDDTTEEPVSLLQELGLQEYEARCFLALTKLSTGTAKDIHEVSEVPRTRVYDAMRVLESQGLVEVQHSSPQQFRSVGISEAVRTLRQKYNDRIDTLESHLESIERRETDQSEDHLQEVWSLTGHDAIESRTLDLIDRAESEVALLVVDESVLSESVVEELHEADERDLSIILGGQTEPIIGELEAEFPGTSVFQTELNFLMGQRSDHEVAISRILLVDRDTVLIGSYYPDDGDTKGDEQAIIASGLENGVVVLLRRLVSTGLAANSDPAQ